MIPQSYLDIVHRVMVEVVPCPICNFALLSSFSTILRRTIVCLLQNSLPFCRPPTDRSAIIFPESILTFNRVGEVSCQGTVTFPCYLVPLTWPRPMDLLIMAVSTTRKFGSTEVSDTHANFEYHHFPFLSLRFNIFRLYNQL